MRGRNFRSHAGFPLGNPGAGDRKIIQATIAIGKTIISEVSEIDAERAAVLNFAAVFLDSMIPIAVSSEFHLIPGAINPMGQDLLVALDAAIDGLERTDRDSKRPDRNSLVENLLLQADRCALHQSGKYFSYAIVETATYAIRTWMYVLAKGVWIPDPPVFIRASPDDQSAALPPFERAAISAIAVLKRELSPTAG
jgi:hypothetical protein